MKTYGQKNKTSIAIKNIIKKFGTKSGYICLNMGRGHIKTIKAAEQYPNNAMVITKWTKKN